MHVELTGVATYTRGLPPLEAQTLYSLLRLYSGEGDLGERILLAVRQIDELGTAILDGYVRIEENDEAKRELKRWKKSIQHYIEELAHPHMGRDRQAIALACFRDFIMKKNPTEQWEDLKECRNQLLDLYTVVAPLPFKL